MQKGRVTKMKTKVLLLLFILTTTPLYAGMDFTVFSTDIDLAQAPEEFGVFPKFK